MHVVSHKSEIDSTVNSVRIFSFEEKKASVIDENGIEINSFLDAILSFKKSLGIKTGKVYDLNERIEKLTWYSIDDDDTLMSVNDLISAAKDLRSTLIRQYISFDFLKTKGIAKDEIKDFKNAIDELKESYDDLESVFFFLPKMEDFTETTKMLSLI